MQRYIARLSVSCLLVSPAVSAGVVMEMVTTSAAGEETDRMQFFVQDAKVRMDTGSADADEHVSMIFVGEEFIILDHHDRSYLVMDEAMIEQIGNQFNAAMQEMQRQLANMPPEQRAMVEQMMQGGMQNMLGGGTPPPPPRVESLGAGRWQDYSCTRYAVYEGGAKTEELCAAPLDDIEGAGEMMAAFRRMATFMEKMIASMPEPMASGMAENPTEFMNRIDGFPVRTAHFLQGVLQEETTLESMREQPVPAERFVVPADYRETDPFADL